MVARRAHRAVVSALGILALAAWGCAPRSAPRAQAPGGSGVAGSPDTQPSGSSNGEPSGAPSDASSGAAGAPLPGGEEPTPDKALPELVVEAHGMHIGGGSNEPEDKAPFHRALERAFPAFLECYRLAVEPWAGGTFGADLRIPRAGGRAEAAQPRTKIKGAGFEACMLAAFATAQFERPKAGPTVISYSVRFTLGKR